MPRNLWIVLLLAGLYLCAGSLSAAPQQSNVSYPVSGKVIDKKSRQPVAYANVFVNGLPGKGASTDSLGMFRIEQVPPGIYCLQASCIGYLTVLTPEYIVSASTPFVEIEMEEDANLLDAVVVKPSPFRKSIESPVGMRIIGLQEIEKSPGANRDVSRIVRAYPGVSFSPIGIATTSLCEAVRPRKTVSTWTASRYPTSTTLPHKALRAAPSALSTPT